MTGKSSKSLSVRSRTSPYVSQSPRVREIFTEQSIKKILLASDYVTDELKGITLRQWQVFVATPLFGLVYERRKFAEYEKYLYSCIEMERKKNPNIFSGIKADFKVRMSVKNEFRMIKDDPKAIKIEILKKSGSEHQEVLFIGYLMSVERKKEQLELSFRDPKICILPLFLASGKQVFKKLVIEFLMEKFICAITSMHFSSVNLGWMVSMWAGYKAESGVKPLFLEYSSPVENISSFQYCIDGISAIEIWNHIHDPTKNEMDSEEVDTFLTNLEKHFKLLFCVDLSHCQLSSIGTSVAAVRKDGKIKIFCNSALPFILRHLTHLAQEFLNI